MTNRAPTTLEPLRSTFFDKYNPLTGSITKESDRNKIKELIAALQPYIDANEELIAALQFYIDASNVTEGYVGKRNAAGQMHGHGTYTSSKGVVYVGEFKDGLYHGHGTYTYADGRVKKGTFKDDKFIG